VQQQSEEKQQSVNNMDLYKEVSMNDEYSNDSSDGGFHQQLRAEQKQAEADGSLTSLSPMKDSSTLSPIKES